MLAIKNRITKQSRLQSIEDTPENILLILDLSSQLSSSVYRTSSLSFGWLVGFCCTNSHDLTKLINSLLELVICAKVKTFYRTEQL